MEVNDLGTYLGDGLYARFDGSQVRLAASDGERITNMVFLDAEVMSSFLNFVAELGRKARAEREVENVTG